MKEIRSEAAEKVTEVSEFSKSELFTHGLIPTERADEFYDVVMDEYFEGDYKKSDSYEAETSYEVHVESSEKKIQVDVYVESNEKNDVGPEGYAFEKFYEENADEFEGKSKEEVYEALKDDYVFFEEWLHRTDEEKHLSLYEYNEMRWEVECRWEEYQKQEKEFFEEKDEGPAGYAFEKFYEENADEFEGKSKEEVYQELIFEYEYFEEWLHRPYEEDHLGLYEYNEMRCVEENGDIFKPNDDDDSYDPYY